MSMTPGTKVCTRADIEKLFALAAEPFDLTRR
jgi:6-phosphofructokinase 2